MNQTDESIMGVTVSCSPKINPSWVHILVQALVCFCPYTLFILVKVEWTPLSPQPTVLHIHTVPKYSKHSQWDPGSETAERCCRPLSCSTGAGGIKDGPMKAVERSNLISWCLASTFPSKPRRSKHGLFFKLQSRFCNLQTAEMLTLKDVAGSSLWCAVSQSCNVKSCLWSRSMVLIWVLIRVWLFSLELNFRPTAFVFYETCVTFSVLQEHFCQLRKLQGSFHISQK